MKYKYKNIYLEETIEEIFSELNNSNTEYERSTFSLEEVYLSKKHKELVVIVDLADNIINRFFVSSRISRR